MEGLEVKGERSNGQEAGVGGRIEQRYEGNSR
jgi:hypothetical protein